MGWTEGTGLGKNRQGRSTHITVKKREDNVGLGHVAPELSQHGQPQWWADNVANTLAKLSSSSSSSSKDDKKNKKRKKKNKKDGKIKSLFGLIPNGNKSLAFHLVIRRLLMHHYSFLYCIPRAKKRIFQYFMGWFCRVFLERLFPQLHFSIYRW